MWNFSGQKVKELTVRLLIARDGKKATADETRCTWDQPSDAFAADLVYLVQDDTPFGAKGKRLPSLSLSFRTGGPSTTHTSRRGQPVEALPHQMSTATQNSTVQRKEALFIELDGTPAAGESVSLGTDEESLAAASKNGRMAIAVMVEWKP